MTFKHKLVKNKFDYTPLLENYSIAHDHSNLNTIAVSLDIEYFLKAFDNLAIKDILLYKWPGIEIVKEYSLNVFEGCCYNGMSLREKKLAITAAMFRYVKTNKAKKLILAELVKTVQNPTEFELQFIDDVLELAKFRSKPGKNKFTISHVLWDARNMHLYNPNMNIELYLYNLAKADTTMALERMNLMKTEAMTNWAKVKHFKLDWPARINTIFKTSDKISWVTSLL